jgi:hypothetical protein
MLRDPSTASTSSRSKSIMACCARLDFETRTKVNTRMMMRQRMDHPVRNREHTQFTPDGAFALLLGPASSNGQGVHQGADHQE